MYRVCYYMGGILFELRDNWTSETRAMRAAKNYSKYDDRCAYVYEFSSGRIVAEFIEGKQL